MGLQDYIPEEGGGQPKPAQQPSGLEHYVDSAASFEGTTPKASATNIDIGAYSPWMPDGVNSRFDMNLKRAQNQSIWEQMGKGIVNLVPNIVGDTVEGLGYLGTLGQFGEDRTYSNWLTKVGQAMKDPMGEVFREHPDQVVDLKDPAWWGGIFSGLVSTGASFAMEGAGLAKLFGKLGEYGKILGMSSKASQIGAEGLSALTMAYGMGAQAGAGVFDEAYATQLQKHIDAGEDYDTAKQHAKEIASNAAATTVQLNTALNSLLMLPTMAPLFKSNDDIMGWWMKDGMKKPEESWGQWASRIKEADPAKIEKLKALVDPRKIGYTHLGTSAAAMGVQGLVNDFSTARGRAIGQGKDPEVHSMSSLLDTFSHFFDDTMNAQGGLDFATGAIGGFFQPLLMDRIPMHKVTMDENGQMSSHGFDGEVTPDGKYQTKLVGTHYLNSVGMRDYFDNVKDKVVADIKRVTEHRDALAKAVASGDNLEAERIKRHLFDVGVLNSVQLGMGSNFAETFKEIRDTDNKKALAEPLLNQLSQLNEQIVQEQDQGKKQQLAQQRDAIEKQIKDLGDTTEAMQKGYAKDVNDNDYKHRAAQAISDIDEFTKLSKDIQKRTSRGDEWDARYGEFLFGHEMDNRSRQRIIQDEEARIKEMEARRNANMHPDEDPVTTQAISDINSDNASRDELLKEEARIRRSMKAVSGDNPIESEKAKGHLKELASKYGVTIGTDDDLIPGAHQILEGIKDKADQLHEKTSRSVFGIEASERYQEWQRKQKDPLSNVVDYVKAMRRKSAEDDGISQDKHALNMFKAQSEIASKNLANLRTTKGKNDFIRQAKATHNTIVKQLKAKIDKNNAATIDNMMSKKNVAELSTLQRSQYKDMLAKRIQSVENDIADARTKEAGLKAELAKLQDGTFLQRLKNKLKISRLEDELKNVSDRIESSQKMRETLEQKVTDVEDVTKPDEEVLPAHEPNKTELTSFNDVAMHDFIHNDKAFEDMLDSIWALKSTGTEEQMLPKARAIFVDTLQGLDHSYLYQEQAMKERQVNMIDNFLKEKLREAGKITDGSENTTPETELMKSVADLPLGDNDKSQMLAQLDEYERHLRDTNDPHNTNALVEGLIGNYGITPESALRVVDAFEKQYTHANTNASTSVEDNLTTAEESQTKTQQSFEKKEDVAEQNLGETDVPKTDQFPEAPAPDTNIGQNFSMDIRTYADTSKGDATHDGIKAINAIKANVLTHEYFDDVVKAISGDTYVKNDKYALNSNLSPLYVKPGYIVPGSKLQLAIDTNFDGSINDDGHFVYGGPGQKKDSFKNYTDDDGKVLTTDTAIGNVPIKIVDPRTGKTIAYLPRIDWITAKYEGTGPTEYRNILDEKYNDKGELILSDNVEKQRQSMLELRRKLVSAHNMGYKEGLATVVTDRTRGIAQRVEPGKASELLPEKGLQFALLQGSSVFVGRNVPKDNAVIPEFMTSGATAGRYNNVPGVLLRDASGRHNFEPLWTDKIGKAEVDTVARAIEVYLSHQGNVSADAAAKAAEHAKQIEDATGFDVTDAAGLQAFVNQYYYYTRAFDDSQITANGAILGGAPQRPEFMLAIARNAEKPGAKSIIKAGVSFLNRLAYAKVDNNGNLNEEFRTLLHDDSLGLASRFRNVIYDNSQLGVKGINSAGKVTEVTYRPESQEFVPKEHESYNDMMKSYSKTTMYGKLQSNDGDFVYYAHPRTELNKQQVMDERLFPKRPTGPGEAPTEVKPQELSDADKNYLENIDTGMDYEPRLNIHSTESSVGTLEGQPASLESLEKLRTFTPLENQNGKTSAEVLAELDRLGIRTIPKGFNPFYVC